jgi:hypothetical protein
MLSMFGELVEFLRERRKYWMLPAFLLLILFGGLFVLTQGSVIAPLIYTLF